MICTDCGGRKWVVTKKWFFAIQDRDAIILVNTKCLECLKCGHELLDENQAKKWCDKVHNIVDKIKDKRS